MYTNTFNLFFYCTLSISLYLLENVFYLIAKPHVGIQSFIHTKYFSITTKYKRKPIKYQLFSPHIYIFKINAQAYKLVCSHFF